MHRVCIEFARILMALDVLFFKYSHLNNEAQSTGQVGTEKLPIVSKENSMSVWGF